MDLLLEIKILIAAFDQETWAKLVVYDNSFHKYAYTVENNLLIFSLC